MNFVWLRRWLPLLLPVAEFAWLAPWVLLISGTLYPGGGPLLTPAALLASLLGGYILAGIPVGTGLFDRPRLRVLALAVLLGLGALWVTHYRTLPLWHPRWIWELLRAAHGAIPEIPPPVLGALAAPLVIWRGLVLGGREFSHFTAEQTFRRGVTWSALFVLGYALYQESEIFDLVRPMAAGYVLLFFFLSLLLLTFARLLGIWEAARGKDPRALAFNRSWAAVALSVAALIVLGGGALAGLAGADIRPFMAPVVRLLAPLLEAAFLVLFFFATLIARLILYLISRLPWRGGRLIRGPEDPLGETLQSLRDLQLSPEIMVRIRWGMVVLVVLVLSVIVLLALTRRRRAVAVEEDERESVWEPGMLGRGLRRWALRRRGAGAGDDLDGTAESVALRKIYRRLLGAAAEAGRPRRSDQTAREFQRTTEPTTPGAEEELRALTATYETVRYGAHRPSRQEVAAAEGWLLRVRAILLPRRPRTE